MSASGLALCRARVLASSRTTPQHLPSALCFRGCSSSSSTSEMGQSFSSSAAGAYAPVVAATGCLLALLKSAADSSGAGGDAGLAATIASLLSSSVEVSGMLLLALASLVVLVATQNIIPAQRKVYVLDFAVHLPHPR